MPGTGEENVGMHLQNLKDRLAEIADLQDSAAVLEWDQQTQMPTAGSARRAEQVATLQKFSHRLLTSTELRQVLDGAEAEASRLDPDHDDRRLVEVTRRDLDEASKLPEELVTERARHSALALEVWAEARSLDDFSRFAPILQKTIDLEKQVAECRGYSGHAYDALLHAYE
ncbi:MAG: carboxypeptidase M32, partial [Armatimonadota bacterium]|nr:carboxypeptidase M32 [Armatimonadota bacterium]